MKRSTVKGLSAAERQGSRNEHLLEMMRSEGYWKREKVSEVIFWGKECRANGSYCCGMLEHDRL